MYAADPRELVAFAELAEAGGGDRCSFAALTSSLDTMLARRSPERRIGETKPVRSLALRVIRSIGTAPKDAAFGRLATWQRRRIFDP